MATDTSQLIEQRLPDNDTGRIFPEDVRTVAHALDAQVPNQRRGGPFFVTFLTQAAAVAAGRAGDGSLESLDPALLCLGARARVELHPDGDGVELVLVFDGTGQGLAVALNGNFQRTVAGKWVKADSAEAVNANVPYYAPNFNAPTGYPVAYLVRYAAPGQGEAFYYSKLAGQLPAPTGAANDPNWKVVPGPVAPMALSQATTLAGAQHLYGNITAGRLYVIDWGQDAQGQGQTVYVQGLSATAYAVQGVLEVAGTRQRVEVDVAAGTFTTLDATAGGALPWAAGKQKGSSLVYNDGAVWRVKADLTNSQAGPTHAAPNAQYYEFVGGAELLTVAATQQQHTQQIATNTGDIAALKGSQPTAGLGLVRTGNVFALRTSVNQQPLGAGLAKTYLDGSTGALVTGSSFTDGYTTSSYLAVVPGDPLTITPYVTVGAWYDASLVFIAPPGNQFSPGSIPAGAAYMRLSYETANYAAVRYSRGRLPYVRGAQTTAGPLWPGSEGLLDLTSLAPLSGYAVIGYNGSNVAGFATVNAAYAAGYNSLYVNKTTVLTATIGSFVGTIRGNGSNNATIIVPDGLRFGFTIGALFYSVSIATTGNGSFRLVGAGGGGGGGDPAAYGAQFIDSYTNLIEGTGSGNNLVLRGTSVVDTITSNNPLTVYLYDQVVEPAVGSSLTVVKRRPQDAVASGSGGGTSYTAGAGISIVNGVISTNADRVYYERWTINDGQYMQSTTTNAGDGYQYYPVAPPKRVSQILPAGATGYNPATGIFTAPYHGLYNILHFVAIAPNELAAGDNFVPIICGPASIYPIIGSEWASVGASAFNEKTFTDIVELQAGQQLRGAVGLLSSQAGRQINLVVRTTVSLYKFLS